MLIIEKKGQVCNQAEGQVDKHVKAPTVVKVRVSWPTRDKEIELPEDLEPLGKMLVRGTYRHIAKAAWKVDKLKEELVDLMVKEVEKETASLCSVKNPSCLRQTDKASIKVLTMEKVSQEMKERSPIFYSFLEASCTNSRSVRRSYEPKNYLAAIGMAGAVCLRSRCKEMIAVQLAIMTVLYHSNWMVSSNLK